MLERAAKVQKSSQDHRMARRDFKIMSLHAFSSHRGIFKLLVPLLSSLELPTGLEF